MRTDNGLGEDFRKSNDWDFDLQDFNLSMTTVASLGYDQQDLPSTKKISNSFSGHERNHMFLNRGGKQFLDLAPISGLDTPGDSRSFGFLDYDRDGWVDIALINANEPALNLFRNEIGDVTGRPAPNFVAVRVVGGNHAAGPSQMAPRDGYGAKVRVRAGDLSMMREFRCGDGFASQNSDTLLIGLGEHPRAGTVAVQWPSGARQEIADVATGTLLTAYEDPRQSPGGQPFVSEPYPQLQARFAPTRERALARLELRCPPPAGDPSLRVYVTMATWCAACMRYLPQLEHLRGAFPASAVALLGVPVDPADDPDKLRVYLEQHRPAYQLLGDLVGDARGEAQKQITAQVGSDALPSTVVTDRDGRVLATFAGVPKVSDVARLLDRP